ncbi:hypothetical protein PTTG_26990 [Puccinia triticina 1-1 BBBD Race 1]|uniref:Uncharacterized protein n=1 Tax=Puccinia triticina (isolate 1-1 / race 1 (BBBD)) TaxID=630390 RepID=A0A180GNM2_PUCT1|nr:hypothetical protein PTTG_26990 [Puccinia triticina 1-1 BBBD Race 1]
MKICPRKQHKGKVDLPADLYHQYNCGTKTKQLDAVRPKLVEALSTSSFSFNFPGAQTAVEKVKPSASSTRHVEKVNPGPKTLLERISVNTKDKVAQDETNQTTGSTQREETEDENVKRLLDCFSKEKQAGAIEPKALNL